MYYQKTKEQIFHELQTSMNGLNEQEVKQRQMKYGKNILEGKKGDTPLIIFIKQFQDLLVLILIIAAIISGMSGQLESMIVIFAVIIINAILGTIQTLKAQKSLESLKKLSSPQIKVKRNNILEEVSSEELTIGDIVYIEAGDVISGDGRVIEASSLQVNESALTGETVSVDKNMEPLHQEVSLADMKNMVFSGSLVTNGTGQYIVTAIGMNSEIGKIASYLNETQDKKTPLQKSLDQFSVSLSIAIVMICIVVLFLNLWHGQKLLEALMIAVALAVGAIPEALTSIVTIVLSMSTQKMVKENAIIKTLNSVETLGCVSVICSDKTGTLTQNKMSVVHIYMNHRRIMKENINGKDHDHDVLLKACRICNNAVINGHQRIGDPTELALIDFINEYDQYDIHYQQTTIRKEKIPFDSQRKLMSVSSKNHLYTKGAFDELIQRCDTILINGKKEKLTKRHILLLQKENEEYASQGLRVLAFAYKLLDHQNITLNDEYHLTFIALITLEDPAREESQEAVTKCKIAGIKPIMITGDHVVTAKAIAKKIGIYDKGDLCLEGKELNTMSDEKLSQILPQVSVYARVAPKHKIRIVKQWQKRGAVVAMTGDGVNDAPALKQSDIGVAMGVVGTEVSKDAADMILTDDNFATIVKAIATGRNVYNNIKNSILYLLSGNFAGILCVLLSSLLVLPTPFYAVHLLFINLMTDSLPAIAIGMEEGKNSILHEKPRNPKDSILNKKTILQISYEGIIIAICTMCSYFMGLRHDPLSASTMAFATICLARLFHGFNCRSQLPLTQIGIFSNHFTIYAFIIGFILLHIILIVPVCHSLFSIHPLSLSQFLCIYGFALIPSLIIQLRKQAS